MGNEETAVPPTPVETEMPAKAPPIEESQPPSSAQMGLIDCPCGLKTPMVPPKQVITNAFEVSAVIYPHEHPVVCKRCGRLYQYVLAGIDVIWVIHEVKKKEESRVIMPGGGPVLIPPGRS